MAKKKGVKVAGKVPSTVSQNMTSKGGQNRAAVNDALYKDTGIVFLIGFVLALILQKAMLYCDWDTIDSVLKMNAAGYNPLSVLPVKYHFIIEPLVYITTSALSPLFGHDNMVGFIVLVSLFSAGLLALTYYATHKITGDRMSAIVATAFLGISYNFLYLTLTVTQNMVNQFFNLLAVLLTLAVIGRVNLRVSRSMLAVALGIAIGLAVGTNMRSLYLLALLPLVVLLDSDRKAGVKNTAIAGACSIVLIGGMALAANLIGLTSSIPGFFNVVYYEESQYWFFAGPGDIIAQASSAGVGMLRSFVGDSLVLGMASVSNLLPILGFAAILGVFAYLLRNSVKDAAVIVIAVPLVISTAHSFFYEPLSLERWDHAVLYLGLLAGIAWAEKPERRKANYNNKIIVGMALAIMAIGLVITIAGAGQTVQYMSFLYAKIPAGSFDEHPGTLVISAGEKSVPAKYMVYLYGQDNISYSTRFATAEEVIPYMYSVRANGTLYIDTNEMNALDGVNGSAPLLDAARPIDEYGIWYRIDKASIEN